MAAEWFIYLVFGFLALACAVAMVFSANPVHSALFLVATLTSIAALFLGQQAYFLSAVQIIVYTGAIVVLFLFVIMLLGIDRTDPDEADRLRNPMVVGLFGFGLLAFMTLLVLIMGFQWPVGAKGTNGTPEAVEAAGGNVKALSSVLFTKYLLPFEVTAALLIAAVVGAVVIAKRDKRLFGAGIGRSREVLEELRHRREADAEPEEPEEASVGSGAGEGEAP